MTKNTPSLRPKDYPIVNDYLHPDSVVTCPYCGTEDNVDPESEEVVFKNLLDHEMPAEIVNVKGETIATAYDYLVQCTKCGGTFIIRSNV